MKTVVISGSASLQNELTKWEKYFKKLGYEILDRPLPIAANDFLAVYPGIYRSFYENIARTDILFIMNEDKNGIKGYIGAETFAEIAFAVALNQTQGKKIYIELLQMPADNVQSITEIKLYLQLGWIRLME